MILIKFYSIILIPILLYSSGITTSGVHSIFNQDTCTSVIHKNNIVPTSGEGMIFSYDTTAAFTITYIEGEGFIAINQKGKALFKVFPFDNGPDYPSEGLFRIIDKGMIGFANLQGEIVIEPKFSAVYPFHGGFAAYCDKCITVNQGEHKSWQKGKWGFIDATGNIVIPAQYDKVIKDFDEGNAIVEENGSLLTIDKKGKPIRTDTMNYHQWSNRLAMVTQLINKVLFDDVLKIESHWIANRKTYSFNLQDSAALKIDIILKENNKPILSYLIVPWQNFSKHFHQNTFQDPGTFDKLMTVTEYAIIYNCYSMSNLNATENNYVDRFDSTFSEVIDQKQNQTSIENDILNVPENIQIISCNIYKHYIDLQVAIPGSRLPEHSRWETISKNKMLCLNLVPDRGDVESRWIKPKDLKISTYYSSVEKDLLELFAVAINKSLQNPEKRDRIYSQTKNNIRNLFCSANSYVNFLNDVYAARLKQWLLTSDPFNELPPDFENIFPDYEPKRSPDTAIDFMPDLQIEIDKIPSARLDNLVELIQLFKIYQERAQQKPGQWKEGNVILGASPQEYHPSPDELVAAEIGDRLQAIVNSEYKADIQKVLLKANIKLKVLEYTRFIFIHIDVMGSGRFFYVDTFEKITLNLE